MPKVHVVFNADGDVVALIEASGDVGFYQWLHVSQLNLELSRPIEVEKPDEFMRDMIERQLDEVRFDDPTE